MRALLEALKKIKSGQFEDSDPRYKNPLDGGLCFLAPRVAGTEASKVRRQLDSLLDDLSDSGKIDCVAYPVPKPDFVGNGVASSYCFDLVAYRWRRYDPEKFHLDRGYTVEDVITAYQENRLKFLDMLIDHLEDEEKGHE